MAAKAKAPAKARKGAVASKKTAARATPKGLQLTTAQWTAYNKAFNATASLLRKQAMLQAFANSFRKYRLNSAYATIKKYQVARGKAQRAAIAAFAARMSWRQSRLAHQNSALQSRIELDMYNHANLSGRLQYAQAGEKAYAHLAVMRTVDQAQALTYEAKFFSKVSKTARAAGASTLKTRSTPLSAAIQNAANAAGLIAARKVSSTTTSTQVAAKKTKTAAKSTKAVKNNVKAHAKSSSKSKKAPAKAPKGRTAPAHTPSAAAAYAQAMANYIAYRELHEPATKPWVGNEFTPNCVVTAIANSLIFLKGVLVTEQQIEELTAGCSELPTIEEVLWKVWLTGWPNGKVRLRDYQLVDDDYAETRAGLVIGFEALTDDGWADHCALSLPEYRVVSWGQEIDRESVVEEAWHLLWES